MFRYLRIAALFLIAVCCPAYGAETIKIGDMYAYTAYSVFAVPYKKGWTMALEERNAAGGLLGKPVEIISRDQGSSPQEALMATAGLLARDGVTVIGGTILGTVTNAVATHLAREKIPFVTMNNTMAADTGPQTPYMFSVTSTESQTLPLMSQAVKWPIKRWAVLAPQYAYGQLAVAMFKRELKKANPDAEIVAEQWFPIGKLEGRAVVNALAQSKPEAIFAPIFTRDLTNFVRSGSLRGLFDTTRVVVPVVGGQENLKPMGEEGPVGWFVSGYNPKVIKDPHHVKWIKAYEKRFGEEPTWNALNAYVVYQFIFGAIEKAGSTDPEAITKALEGLVVDTPVGPVTMQAHTHRSTLGIWTGITAMEEGQARMAVDVQRHDGAEFLPTPEKVEANRKASVAKEGK